MSFIYISGGDDFLVSRMGKAVFEELTAGIEDEMAREVIDGGAQKVEDVEKAVANFRAAVQTISMFGDKKVVWLRDVSFLADSQTGKAGGTLEQLELLQQTLETLDPAAVAVLITAFPVDRRKKFPKWLEKNGDFRQAGGDKKKGGEQAALAELIAEECLVHDVRMQPAAAEMLVAKVNGNTRLVLEEVRKLATYLGEPGATIKEEHVAELVPNFGEGDFFEAAEAFASGDLQWTLDALRRHFFTTKESRPLLATLQTRNRLMIQLRILMDAGEISKGGASKTDLDRAARTHAQAFAEAAGEKSSFNVFTQNPWYLGRLAQAASKRPLRKLVDFQQALIGVFESIIARPNEQEQVLRELAVKTLG